MKLKKINKKGILLSQGMKIILTVLALLLLIYLAGKLMGILVKNRIPDCKVDSENMVLNAPCNCGSFGVISQKKSGEDISLEPCKGGEYCYEDRIGCSEKRLERKSEKKSDKELTDDENFNLFLNTKVSFENEEVKIGDIIKYSLDPFYEVYSTSGINTGKSFAEIKFKKYGNQNGLEILSLRHQQDYYGVMEGEGFRTILVKDKDGKTTILSKIKKIERFVVDFEKKSEEFKILVRELNKICDNYMLLMPQGVIYNAAGTDKVVLSFGPGVSGALYPVNTPWNELFAMDWKELRKKISYGGINELTDVDFEIKLKLPNSCFMRMKRKF